MSAVELTKREAPVVDDPWQRIHERRRPSESHRRGWLVRRMLLCADVAGLLVAFAAAEALAGTPTIGAEWLVFLGLLPIWIVMAKIYGLYDRDEERPDHSTVDDFVGVFHLVTVAAWLLAIGSWLRSTDDPGLGELVIFWSVAIPSVMAARVAARSLSRKSTLYTQNMVIVGAGEVGQLVARKVLQHPEYGINVLGFVDDDPRTRRAELDDVPLLGPSGSLPEVMRTLQVDRVVVAFSKEPPERTVEVLRSLADYDVQIDVVPRLFDVIGQRVAVHSVEALPMIGLPPVRLSRSSQFVKRLVDVIGSSILLVVTLPILVGAAVAVRLDSPGPALFRQRRIGQGMRDFTLLKFRTMKVDTDQSVHRDYIRDTMTAGATVGDNGIYKLDRADSVTRVGRFLRKTSIDELPQLLNVLKGDMSLVGPRPCLRYETELFRPHQFERFLVPSGITGLWQVTARARSTFGEALDMDVAYARGWSLGLDFRLLFQTPLQLLRQRGTA
jgi:exopolysaccharide biosynthesis polyprenyl glycosylphosphotransferase